MKTVVCLIFAALLALPRAGQAVEGFQDDLRRNLACTAASYAALDDDATEADYARAVELCPADPVHLDALR
jgi:hypothetical protein